MTAKFFKSNGFKFYGAKMVIEGHWRTRWFFKPQGATGYAKIELGEDRQLKRVDVEHFLGDEATAFAAYCQAFPAWPAVNAGVESRSAQLL